MTLPTSLPHDEDEVKHLMTIATGKEMVYPSNYFRPLVSVNSSEQNSDHVLVDNNEFVVCGLEILNDDVEREKCQSPTSVISAITENENRVLPEDELRNLGGKNEEPLGHEKCPLLDDVDVELQLKLFQSNVDEIIDKAQINTDILKAVQCFNENFKRIRSNAGLISALCTFSKYSGGPRSARIRVQPTAISRRKAKYKGRTVINSGRVAKINYTKEPAYNKTVGSSFTLQATKSRNTRPHCLSERVSSQQKP